MEEGAATNILRTPEETLKGLLYGVGFHNQKAKYLREASKILRDEHHGVAGGGMYTANGYRAAFIFMAWRTFFIHAGRTRFLRVLRAARVQ